jgi:isopentenyl diphosphate isomerase/L-lactate dehydrogenase-like FMN-dependent dehydrogenase
VTDHYGRLLLRPRILRNVSIIDTSTVVLGKRYNFPIAIGPTAYQKLASELGEIDTRYIQVVDKSVEHTRGNSYPDFQI